MKKDYTLLRRHRSITTTTIAGSSEDASGGAHFWVITEPTIAQFLELRRRALKKKTPAAVWLVKEYAAKRWLKAGQADTITLSECDQVFKTVLDMCDQQVLKPLRSATAKDSGGPDPIYDLPLLRALDMIGRRYGMLPQDLAKRLTLRQLHYLYYLAYNAELDDQERQILLAGGKLKERAERLELIAEDSAAAGGQSTAGMSVAEKAAYFSRQRRAEGREPGRM